MEKKNLISMLIMIALFVIGIVVFTLDHQSRERMIENRAKAIAAACPKVAECPPCPEAVCPEESPCIYNDSRSVKKVRFVHKDGRVCYGIKPYGSDKFEAYDCPAR
jgi:hypothetical protein